MISPVNVPPLRCREAAEGGLDTTSEKVHGRQEDKTQSDRKWQSDIIADLIKQYGFPYITLNPGASYRGLHDSLVNHNGDDPPMLLCQHEKIAVQIAHGYAKASGQPLCVIVHNVVGLLHATMGIYYAYTDRAPVFVIGATGPMDEGKRRPRVDWEHTAQRRRATQVRDYVKWDYQPGGIEGVPDSFARAYSIMMTEPQGPIYMCYDAAFRRRRSTEPIKLPDPEDRRRCRAGSRPILTALARGRRPLVAAEWPVLLPQFVGRDAERLCATWSRLPRRSARPVVDVHVAAEFPDRASARHAA